MQQAALALLAPLADEAASTAASQAISAASADLRHQAEGILEAMATDLAERCVAVVKQLKARSPLCTYLRREQLQNLVPYPRHFSHRISHCTS